MGSIKTVPERGGIDLVSALDRRIAATTAIGGEFKRTLKIGALAEAPLATCHEISEYLRNFGVNVALWQLNFIDSMNAFNSRSV